MRLTAHGQFKTPQKEEPKKAHSHCLEWHAYALRCNVRSSFLLPTPSSLIKKGNFDAIVSRSHQWFATKYSTLKQTVFIKSMARLWGVSLLMATNVSGEKRHEERRGKS